MIRLMMKNYNMILIGKLQKYMSYNQVKLVSMNILQVKLNLLIVLLVKPLKNKTKKLKIKEKNKLIF